MAYDVENAAKAILKLKNDWSEADMIGDNAGKQLAADRAKTYYEQLRSNGYGDVADKLGSSNLSQAQDYVKKYYDTTGRVATRDYYNNLGKSVGWTPGDVDKYLKYNDTTGEVSFGGYNLGVPDANIKGVSYYNDESKLKDAWDKVISNAGATRTTTNAVNQENENLFRKYSDAYDNIVKTNPFETDEGKAIMGKYDLAALTGRDNELASGAASNGGNIDSFAAANAMRQQAALVNQGQQAVINAHNAKVENARKLLSDIGVNIDRVFNQNETALNNEVDRNVKVSETAGKVTNTLSKYYNDYFNEDGTLKNPNIDYMAIINSAEDALKNTADESERNRLMETIRKANEARNAKINSDPEKYSKYIDTMRLYPADNTLSRDELDAQERMNADNNATKLYGYDIDAATEMYKTDNKSSSSTGSRSSSTGGKLTFSQAQTALKNGELSQPVLDVYNAYLGTDYTLDNPPSIYKTTGSKSSSTGGSDSSGSTKPLMTESEINSWVKYLNSAAKSEFGVDALKQVGKANYTPSINIEYIVAKVIDDDNLTTDQKNYLLTKKFGITNSQLEQAYNGMRGRN